MSAGRIPPRASAAALAASVVFALAAGGVEGQTPDGDGSAPALAVEVPFIPQSELLCGGAAAAMVLRFHGERGVGPRAFARLVRPDEHGIRTDELAAELERGGWKVASANGDLDAIASALRAGLPPIVLLGSGRGRWHYVVVVGLEQSAVRVHDPALGPDLELETGEFLRRWEAGRRWMLVVEGRTRPPNDPASPTARSAEARGAAAVDAAPSPPALLAASERFRAGDWTAAASAARTAAGEAPTDLRAWRLLGASLYLGDRRDDALDAWARADGPTIDEVVVNGLARTRHDVIHRLLGLEPGERLARDDLARARRRLSLLSLPLARVDYRAEPEGWVEVQAAVLEAPAHPFERRSLAAEAIAAASGELDLWESGLAGAGERIEVRWRPGEGARVELAAPGVLGLGGRTDVGMARTDEAEAAWLRTTDWATGWLRWEAGARVDRDDGTLRPALTGALHLASAGDGLGLRVSGVLSGGAPVSALAALDLDASVGSAVQRWSAGARLGARVVTQGGPVALRPAAGDRGRLSLAGPFSGPDPAPLLRAHDRVEGARLLSGGVEGARWAGRTIRFGAAAFLDAALVENAGASRGLADAGIGARINLSGVAGSARLDYAWALADHARRWSVGWSLPGGARLAP